MENSDLPHSPTPTSDATIPNSAYGEKPSYIGLRIFIGLALFLLSAVFTQLLNLANQEIQAMLVSEAGITGKLWFYAAAQIAATFTTDAMLLVLAALIVVPQLQSRFFYFFNQVLVESLRSWGKILLGFLFFILPGLVLFLRYLMVPFIVLFDKDYDLDKVDVLQRSRNLYQQLSAKHWGLLLLVKILIPTLLVFLFDDVDDFFKSPTLFLLFIFLQCLTVVLAVSVLQRLITSRGVR